MSKEYELAFRMNAELDARFSRVFTQASDRIGSLERKLNELNGLGTHGPKFGSGIVSGLESIMSTAAKVAKYTVGGALVGGAVAAGYAIKSSLDKAMDFESEMSTIAALTGATNEQMAKMDALALKMGANTKYSALEAAQGIEELLKAGLTPAAVQAGGLEAALNLATAGGLDLAEAASTMATSLNAFKKDGLTAAQVANILAGNANAAATDVHEIGYGIAQAGNVADMAGLSFKDLNTAIGLLSNDGLKSGSDAGTSFKSMLMYLQPQTKEATKLFNQLGIGVGKFNKFFENGKIKDLAGIAEEMHKAFSGMSEQTRTDKMLDMFGTDGVKAATTLYKAGAKGVKDFQKQMMNVTALDVARKKMDNASGAVEQFKGAIETLQISALQPTLPILKDLANEAADFVTEYTPEITAAVDRMVSRSKAYFNEHFFNNPEFQNLPTLESKINFVFNDVMETFNGWWATGGRDSFEGVTEDVAGFMISALEATVPEMADVGMKLGGALGQGMWTALENSKIGWMFKDYGFLSPQWVDDIWAISNGDKDRSWMDVGKDFMMGPLAPDRDKKPAENNAPPGRAAPLFQDGRYISPQEFLKSNVQISHISQITIQGNADESTVNKAVQSGNDDFEKRLNLYMAQLGRVSLSP